MRKLKLYITASIDGYIAPPDGDLDWLVGYPVPSKEDHKNFLDSVDTVIIGGNTYRNMFCMDILWPYKDKTVYIVTRHSVMEKEGVNFITENIAETISKLKGQNGKDIWLVGGAELTSILLDYDLIDEMIITTVPIILGNGIPLFSKITKESQWEISIYHKYKNVVTQSHYKIKR